MSSRSVTPVKKQPTIIISNDAMDNIDLYLNTGELLVSKGYPAPPPKEKEIRKCVSCHMVYVIVLKTSDKINCGYCTHVHHN